jgi:hypothetical protein
MAIIAMDNFPKRLRDRSIRPETGQILISRIKGSAQEGDLTEPSDCGGYGRIRHFRQATPNPWPPSPSGLAKTLASFG